MTNIMRQAFIENEKRRLRAFEDAVVGLNMAEAGLRLVGQSTRALDLHPALVHCKKAAERCRLNIAVAEREAAREERNHA